MRKAILSLVIGSLIILPLANVLAVGTDYRYTGKPLDSSTNLYYYGQRYYDPSTGQFTQPDPVSNNLTNPQKLKQTTGQDLQQYLTNPQNFNNYSYTQNNPVKYTDPDGEYVFTVVGGTVGGIVGMAYSYKNVGSFFKNVFHGNLSAASDDAEAFLSSGGKGMLLGASIGMVGDTVWGLVGLAKMSSPTWQINSASRTVQFTQASKFTFAQKSVSTRFSNTSQTPEFLRGRLLDDVIADVKANPSLASKIEVNYVVRDGVKIINNNRSAVVLQRAGIDISKWKLINQTGNNYYENSVNTQLQNNNLTSAGVKTIKY